MKQTKQQKRRSANRLRRREWFRKTTFIRSLNIKKPNFKPKLSITTKQYLDVILGLNNNTTNENN